MKRISNLILVAAFLVSCESEDSLTPQKEVVLTQQNENAAKHKVELNISLETDYESDSVLSKVAKQKVSSVDSLKNHIDELYFKVYQGFTLVSEIYQDSNNVDFGSLTGTLAPGDYTVVVIGARGRFHVGESNFMQQI